MAGTSARHAHDPANAPEDGAASVDLRVHQERAGVDAATRLAWLQAATIADEVAASFGSLTAVGAHTVAMRLREMAAK